MSTSLGWWAGVERNGVKLAAPVFGHSMSGCLPLCPHESSFQSKLDIYNSDRYSSFKRFLLKQRKNTKNHEHHQARLWDLRFWFAIALHGFLFLTSIPQLHHLHRSRGRRPWSKHQERAAVAELWQRRWIMLDHLSKFVKSDRLKHPVA